MGSRSQTPEARCPDSAATAALPLELRGEGDNGYKLTGCRRKLADSLFSFSILNISTHCLLAYEISDEVFADNLIEDPLYVTACFSLSAFKTLCLWLFDSLKAMCLCVGLFEFILS